MKHIFKIIILFLALISTSVIYAVGMFDYEQNQTDKELNALKNELSDINYEKEIGDLYNKVDKLYDIYKEQSKKSNSEDKTTNKTEDKTEEIKKEPPVTSCYGIYDDLYSIYYGRLYVPDLNINVALYYGYEQYITDRVDSANIFFFGDDDGMTIADHNYQEFAKLFRIKVGMQGYIQNKYRGRINIKCVDVFTGYNDGKHVVDESGVNAMNRTDYMMYTCHYSEGKVLICLWDII